MLIVVVYNAVKNLGVTLGFKIALVRVVLRKLFYSVVKVFYTRVRTAGNILSVIIFSN